MGSPVFESVEGSRWRRLPVGALWIVAVHAVPNPTSPPGTPTYDAYALGTEILQAALDHPREGTGYRAGYVVLYAYLC